MQQLTKKLNQVLAVVLTIVALMTGQQAWAQNPATIGSISYNSTLGAYEIANENNLKDLAVYVNGSGNYTTGGDAETVSHDCVGLTFKVTGNITLTHTTAWNDANSTEDTYTSIGTHSGHSAQFKGTFDGQGNTISGIRIYKNGYGNANSYQGLFGYINTGGTVKNVWLSNARIVGHMDIGGIVGHNYGGTVENCHVGADVAIVGCNGGSMYAGGIAGANERNAVINGCTSAADIGGYQYVGGIVGLNLVTATIEYCLAIGVSITGYAGGGDYGPVVGLQQGTAIPNYHYGCSVNGVNYTEDVVDIYANGSRKTVAITFNTNAPGAEATVTLTSPDVVYAYDGIKYINKVIAYDNKLYARPNTADINFTVAPPAGYTLSNVSGATANGDGSYKVSAGTTDMSIAVSLNVITYNITYVLDGGTNNAGNPTTYTAATNTFTLAEPTKSSCQFVGWSGTGLDGITRTVTIAKGSTGHRTYTAHWKAVTADYAGTGTEADPYIISTKTEWEKLATNSTSHDFDGQYILLTDDIGTTADPVTVILATNEAKPFKGKLNGNAHAITINLTDDATDNGLALIRFAGDGCDIKNLVVKGNITTSKENAGGFISRILNGSSSYTVTISNSRSSVVINTSYNGVSNSGGFVGIGGGSVGVTLNNCLFDGAFISSTAHYMSGMTGWCGGAAKFYSCLVAPTDALSLTYSGDNVKNYTFSERASNSSFDSNKPSYYRTAIGTAQGTDGSGMSVEALAAALGDNWEVVGGEVLPIMDSYHMKRAIVSGLTRFNKATGSAINLNYSVADALGRPLTKGTDYTETITDSRGVAVTSIVAEGDYTLTLSGMGLYRGSLSIVIGVGQQPEDMEEDGDYPYPNYEHFYVLMPSGSNTKTVTLTDNIRKFNVYDDGGKNGNYSNSCNATLTLTAPEDYVLRISGKIKTESPYDYLKINNGSNISGGEKEISVVTSEGQTMTLLFHSNNSTNYKGLDLTVELVPEFIELSEDAGITAATATQIAGKKVRFHRTFKADRASTVCLPFAMSSITGGKVYEFVSVAYDDTEGVKAWAATMNDATPGGNLVTPPTTANKPYLFLPDIPTSGNVGDDVVVTFSGTADATVEAGESTSGEWKFKGTYTRLEYKADGSANLSGYVYGFASTDATVEGHNVQAGEFVHAIDGAGVPPFRCYLTYDNGGQFAGAPAIRRSADGSDKAPSRIIVRLVDANGETTGVGSINNGELIMDNLADTWYSLDGRKFSGKPTSKGLYINNGRKVVIK